MEISAIYHDISKKYCFAIEKGKILFRIKTKKDDIKKIVLHYKDKYIPVKFFDTRNSTEMTKVACDGKSDYFEGILDIDVICLRYFFELTDFSGKTLFYGNYEFFSEMIESQDYMFDCPQNLKEEEMFLVPQWAKNKVVYQIFPSRFATTKNVPDNQWYKTPISHKDNLQGDIRGIINHLDHIKELGIDIIYMTPLFKSDSCHKYDTIDYYKIDESFGTNQDFKELVEKAHQMDIKIILDGVFNHTSPKFFAFQDIQKNEEKSKYLDWYFIEDFPLKFQWGTKPNFKTFAYFGGMPKLNVKNPEVADYFCEVGKYWIKNYDVDGWRLDVADEISHKFWKRFRQEIKSVKPDALIVGEIWHYAGDFLEGDEWDSVMNYPFYSAIQDFVAKGTITATQFIQRLDFLRGNLNNQVIPILLNLIDSHDTARFLHQCNENKSKQKLAASIQLLFPGMPMIYYGDEFGLTGAHDPDCRRGMLWKDDLQDKNMFEWYKSLIKIRKTYPCITEGKTIYSFTDDEKGIIILTKELENKKITMIFHGKDDETFISNYEGKNLLTNEQFLGTLGSFETVILES